MASIDSFTTRAKLSVGEQNYPYYRLDAVERLKKLPYSLKILAKNLLRTEDGQNITTDHITALANWDPEVEPDTKIQFTPARIIIQGFTGVPCVVDLATMREVIVDLGEDPTLINPFVPAEMVTDHSVQVGVAGAPFVFEANVEREYERNRERYQFLHWGQGAFDDFKAVPSLTGIVHQVNIEHLVQVVFTRVENDGTITAYPDTCVGTDSHTTVVNGLGVLGWGVGGIEAEAAMLGQPVSILIPRVVGFKLTGQIPVGATATDAVLTVTQELHVHGVISKFVEFYGSGVSAVPLANRATIGNMSPEFGSTATIFPIDEVTLDYLRLTDRSEEFIALVEAYAKAQGLWHDPFHEVRYFEYLGFDLANIIPSIAGPKRPQDRITLSESKGFFCKTIADYAPGGEREDVALTLADGTQTRLNRGDVAIASITSCTGTSNPSVMMAAGFLTREAITRGLKPKPWMKTSLAPGSKVVTDYFEKAGLWGVFNALGLNLIGYGCATCISNSGPLSAQVSVAVNENNSAVVSVLPDNRNFEDRINPDVKMSYLASPPLVIVYALAGTMDFDFDSELSGTDPVTGEQVSLKDIWPSPEKVQLSIDSSINREMFEKDYADVFAGDERWQELHTPEGDTFSQDSTSTYARKLPYFEGISLGPEAVENIHGARVLLKLDDSVTTDHISPAGALKPETPAGQHLLANGVERKDFNSYGSRRGSHEVMIRGTFANIRIRNEMVPGVEGGFTKDFAREDAPTTTVYEAVQDYPTASTPLIVLGDKKYGSDSSRNWVAKGTSLLGVKAVIAESLERIHRSNLIGMGVLPLEFSEGQSRDTLGLTGEELLDIEGMSVLNEDVTSKTLCVTATREDFSCIMFDARLRIDTPGEADYYRNGGILQCVLRDLTKRSRKGVPGVQVGQ